MNDELNLPQLPASWILTSLESCCQKITDGSHFTPKYVGEGFPFITISDLEKEVIDFASAKLISKTDFEHLKENCNPRKGDVLFSKDGTIGKVIEIDFEKDFIVLSSLAIIRPYDVVILPHYLRYLLKTNAVLSQCVKLKTGTALTRVILRNLRTLKIPVAPINEQRRIVEKIEELFTLLDAGVESLRRTRVQLKRYRQTMLKYAFEGKLTEEWRKKQIEKDNAQLQLERIIAERRQVWIQEARGKYKQPLQSDVKKLPELPLNWVWATVDQLSIVVRGASPRPAGHPRLFGGAIPWITVGPLTADEQPYLQNVAQSVTEEGRRASRYIEPHTLLLTNSGATLGVPKITLIGGCINDGVVALLHVNYPLKVYLYYYLKTQTKRLRDINQGAAQPNLNTGIIKAICIPFPPLNEQKQIVTEIQSAFTRAETAETNVTEALTAAERLRAAILAKAFEGKLVPQSPVDESAEKLLERIKGEKARTVSQGSNNSKQKVSNIVRREELSRYVK